MNATLERLIALKADTTTTGQMDYLDQVLSDAVTICRRPGDVERCATYIDELVGEIATTRATLTAPPAPKRPQEPAGDDFSPRTGPAYLGTPTRHAGANTANPTRTTFEPSTGTGTHRAQEPA